MKKTLLTTLILLTLLTAGCTGEDEMEEGRISITPLYDMTSMDGYTGNASEALYVFPADGKPKSALQAVVKGEKQPPKEVPTTITLVAFRGVYPTGGYSIAVTKVVRKGDEVKIYANYTDPGEGRMVAQAFTSPAAFVQMELPPGQYTASLIVTKEKRGPERAEVVERQKKHHETTFRVTEE